MTDIEDIVKTASTTYKPFNMKIEDISILKNILNDMFEVDDILNYTKDDFFVFIRKLQKKYHINFGNYELLYVYRLHCKEKNITIDQRYVNLLQKKTMRSQSGVQVFSIGTSPIFPGNGCAYTCKYCSCEENAPKSYNIDEPGMARAFQNDFKPLLQIWDRANTYYVNGHPVDKGEMIVIGGTWDSYPISYQEEVMTEIYYSANIYHDNLQIGNTDVKNIDYTMLRKKLSLEEEMKINETSDFRIIGLTIETRPDNVTPLSIKRYRRYGVTRVQMGIQHIDDRVLERADRKCSSKKVIKAIKLLKDNCFKVDGHFMPDLCKPLKIGVSPYKEPIEYDDIDWDFDMYEADRRMFNTVINSEEWQLDQWKIYPLQIVEKSKFKEEYEKGLHKSYAEEIIENPYATLTRKGHVRTFTKLHELLMEVKSKVPRWIRLNRVIRDIPISYISGGTKDSGMRDILKIEMKHRGLKCQCIRCREVKKQNIDTSTAEFNIETYKASGGIEHHLTYDSPADDNFGFLRLRFNSKQQNKIIFNELIDCALIRELHVYGQTTAVNKKDITVVSKIQHKGFGTKLVNEAIRISKENGYKKIAVISGNGVKEYYRKFGFEDEGMFMVKHLDTDIKKYKNNNVIIYIIVVMIILYIMLYMIYLFIKN